MWRDPWAYGPSLSARLIGGLAALIFLAYGAESTAEVLKPLVPNLLLAIVVIAAVKLMFGRRNL